MDKTCVVVHTESGGHHLDWHLGNTTPKAQRHGACVTFCSIQLETTRATDIEPMSDVLKGVSSLRHCGRFQWLYCIPILGSASSSGFSLPVAVQSHTHASILDVMAQGIIHVLAFRAKPKIGITARKMVCPNSTLGLVLPYRHQFSMIKNSNSVDPSWRYSPMHLAT